MRPAARLFAAVRPAAQRVLQPGAPTGLTGLFTHAAPRPTLLFLYSQTLDKLKQLPESSVYRQSTEALTRHRANIVESVKPAGYDEWLERVKEQIANEPEIFEKHGMGVKYNLDGKEFISMKEVQEADEREEEWDSEPVEAPTLEGVRTTEERRGQREELGEGKPITPDNVKNFRLEAEPSLTADQIAEVENQIGSGLIEEVIRVAEGELELVDSMTKERVWEELCEKPAEGQWKYFER
ncbi:uncharacterized protein K452DRAFT_216233, partial [Aplosporella prunicola CBS 121167]